MPGPYHIIREGGALKMPSKDGRPLYITRQELEACCCPAPGTCHPGLLSEYLLRWYASWGVTSTVEYRIEPPIIVSGTPCSWTASGVTVERQIDGGGWSVYNAAAVVYLKLVTDSEHSFWQVNVLSSGVTIGFPPRKFFGPTPVGEFYHYSSSWWATWEEFATVT